MSTTYPPKGMMPVIVIVGKMNAGKSSVLNSIVGQKAAITDTVGGTTTDTVIKNYELLPFGPVTFYDTAGFDDAGSALSQKRVNATKKALEKADVVLLITDNPLPDETELKFKDKIKQTGIPLLVVFNRKKDGAVCDWADITVSANDNLNTDILRQRIIKFIPDDFQNHLNLLDGIVKAGDKVGLITPLDEAAPKGRLILPQTEVLREVLDKGGVPILSQSVTKEFLSCKPDLIIADSSAVKREYPKIPAEIPITTFSLLFIRNKGNLKVMIQGAKAVKTLKNKDKILIAEGCSHRITCHDIGREKIPNLISKLSGKDLSFDSSAGNDFPEDLSPYSLVVHCGACMLNRRQTLNRIKRCELQGVPVTNYGVLFSLAAGILDKMTAVFKDVS